MRFNVAATPDVYSVPLEHHSDYLVILLIAAVVAEHCAASWID
jgi:hypothetical protein